MTLKEQIIAKIDANNETVGVIGLGYVVLTIAVNFAKAGVKNLDFNISDEKVDAINHSDNYVQNTQNAVLVNEVINKHLLSYTTNFTHTRKYDTLQPYYQHTSVDMRNMIEEESEKVYKL